MVPEVKCFPSWSSTRFHRNFRSELNIIRKQQVCRHQKAGAAVAEGRDGPGPPGDGHVSVKTPRLIEELKLPQSYQCIHACTVGKFCLLVTLGLVLSPELGLRHHVTETNILHGDLSCRQTQMATSKVAMNLTPLSI